MEDDDTSRWRPALEPWLRDLGESSGVAFARASPRESEHGRGLFATSDGVGSVAKPEDEGEGGGRGEGADEEGEG